MQHACLSCPAHKGNGVAGFGGDFAKTEKVQVLFA
jgi:hypothetical protein